MQIALIWRIYKEATAAFDLVDNRLIQFLRNGRTAFAAAQIAPLPDMVFADIAGGVHDDRPLMYVIVPAPFDAFQMQGVTVLANKGIARDIETEAAHETIVAVREAGSHQRTRITAMRDPGIEQQTAILHVDDKQAFLRAGERKIDDG